jgi:hypothetical protein
MSANPQLQALMELAGRQQQGAGPQGAGPQGASPQAPGALSQGAQTPPHPIELIQSGLMALMLGMDQMGLTETGAKIVQTVQKAVERMAKTSPGGRQAAALGAMTPPTPPPGVGTLPNL